MLWAIRHADGKFPCKKACMICQKSRGLKDEQEEAPPATIGEVLRPSHDYEKRAPPGCEQLKQVPESLRKGYRISETDKKFRNIGGFKQSFLWLMEHLLPPSDLVKGCELIFPDTAFFDQGKAILMIKMDKEFCLQGTRNPKKLSFLKLVKDFQEVMKERKREQGIFQQKYGQFILEDDTKNLTKYKDNKSRS